MTPTPADDSRPWLLVFHRDGLKLTPLETSQTVTVGRTAPSDVIVPARQLSRRHARFGAEGREVWVEDLDSTNGTWVNGRRLTARQSVSYGDLIQLGTVVVELHPIDPMEGQLYGMSSHDGFQTAATEELVRARTFRRQIALVMVRALSDDGRTRSNHAWTTEVRRMLRPVDRVGMYSRDTVEIGLPEAGEAGATELAERIASAQLPGCTLLCGVAVYPDHGSTTDEILAACRAALRRATPQTPVQVALGQGEGSDGPTGPVVRAPLMVEIYRTVRRIANSTIPVLIQGETGVGKEVVARALHDASPRRELPFRCINCGAIPSSLVESVLFGHERGAFTGADRRSPGIFEQTDGGTVLLDEVGELSQSAQVALLRVIETKTIARVGGSEDVPVDVRVLAATHRNLEDMSSSGTFRLDLLYRLNALTLAIPPLRERRSEVAHLARHFLTRAATENDRAVSQITPDAIEALEHWEWPGNVRELRNVIDRAVVIATGASITIDELPERLQRSRLQGATTSPAPMRFSRPTPLRTPSKGPGAARPASLARLGLKTALQRCENALIRTALERTGANRTHTAELLGIPRRSLLYRLSTMNETDLDSADRDGRVLARWTEPGDHELRYKDRIHRVEGRMIAEALREAQGDRNRTAHLLGIQRRTLMTKLSRHGLGANSLESP